jgi:hypothetical protein
MAMLKATAEIKKTLFILGILGLTLCSGLYGYSRIFNSNDNLEHERKEVQKLADQDEIQSGDIIFQTSLSEQSKAIQLATKSEYSHCGIIFKEGNDYYVFEAIQPVKRTPID